MKNDDGLKFMNTRENLLKILESKKTNGSKLAWKVTECYPFDLKDEEKLKQSTVEWDHTRPAGTESIKCDTIKDLMRLENIPSPLVSWSIFLLYELIKWYQVCSCLSDPHKYGWCSKTGFQPEELLKAFWGFLRRGKTLSILTLGSTKSRYCW